MIFAAMVDNVDNDGDRHGSEMGTVTKANAKLCLRAAFQALLGEPLEPWSDVLTETRVDVYGSCGSENASEEGGTVGYGPAAEEFLRRMAADGYIDGGWGGGGG